MPDAVSPPAPVWRPALVLFAVLTLLTGLAYPLAVTALAQALFPHAAGGSLILRDGRAVGSALIGQSFAAPGHFWGRPSATGATPYDAMASGGSNLGPSHPDLVTAVAERLRRLEASDPAQAAPVPVDLVTASASGLDPHISRAAALWQLPRVARERGLPIDTVARVVDEFTEWPWLGFLGEPRVNVLRLNLALEALPVR